MKKLDAEKGIEGNLLSPEQSSETDRTVGGGSVGPIVIVRSGTQVKGLEGTELLDVVLTYLWRVHSVDYYGMTEYKEPPKRLRHIRAVEAKTNGESKSNVEELDVADWDKKLDSVWQARLQSGDIIISMLGREKLDTTANEALDPFVRKIRDEKYGWKYGCGAKGCTKLFHGPEFVHKHLKLKHSDLVADVVAKAREDIYFQNYMRSVVILLLPLSKLYQPKSISIMEAFITICLYTGPCLFADSFTIRTCVAVILMLLERIRWRLHKLDR